MEKLIGPFKQLLTFKDSPLKGALADADLEIIVDAGIWVLDGKIKEIGNFQALKLQANAATIVTINYEAVVLPSFIDCHTHIAFGGNRALDFALRNAGSSYLEIAAAGGGIWSTVQHTRACSLDQLVALTIQRAEYLLAQGITTVEVKSGYGLNIEEELKILRAIKLANQISTIDLIATCLAAHSLPKDRAISAEAYLTEIENHLFPYLKEENLTHRIDAFVEQSAFSAAQIRPYFAKAKAMGFEVTVHADQFTTSGSALAVEFAAQSADHLEVSTDQEIELLAHSSVVAVALPAASLGIGCAFTPARKLLDAGASLAIASDWNPGSAPMGNLIIGASILATLQKLSNAEVLAAITFRAANALGLRDRGRLCAGMLADFVVFPTPNYQDITYLQGGLKPSLVYKNGLEVFKIKSNDEHI